MGSNNKRIIVPERKIVQAKPKWANVGEKTLDYLDPELGRNVVVGQMMPGNKVAFDIAVLNHTLSVLFNRNDSLVREVISLRERLSKLDNVPIPAPELPPGVTNDDIVGAPQNQQGDSIEDAFEGVAELARGGRVEGEDA